MKSHLQLCSRIGDGGGQDFGVKLPTQLHAWDNMETPCEKSSMSGKGLTGDTLCLAV